MIDPLSRPVRHGDAKTLGVVAAVTAFVLATFPLHVGRHFGGVLKDFGGAALPSLTRCVLTWWAPTGLGVVALVWVLVGVRAPVAHRRTHALLALLVGIAGLLACVFAVYLPLFQLAGNIRAE